MSESEQTGDSTTITSPGLTVRGFRFPDDFDPVIDLWRLAGPGIHLGRSDERREIENKLNRDPELFLVAEARGEIASAVLGGFDGRRGIVYHLAVAKTMRGQGVGSALMSELEGRLRSKGCLRAYLLVTPDNETAYDFYKERGWERLDLIVMGKDIA